MYTVYIFDFLLHGKEKGGTGYLPLSIQTVIILALV